MPIQRTMSFSNAVSAKDRFLLGFRGDVARVVGPLLCLTMLWLTGCPARSAGDERAAGEPRGELRVCGENLDRFGQPRHERGSGDEGRSGADGRRGKRRRRDRSEGQLEFLVQRMKDARCDIVAVQELYGGDKAEAEKNAATLARALSDATNREFRAFAGESEDVAIRNGFLVASDLGTVVEVKSYDDEPLLRLKSYGPVGKFQRPPIGLFLRLPGQAGERDTPISVFVLNFHFKSRSFGFKDIFHTDFETLRMEMAETTRRIFEREAQWVGKNGIAVMLGDRNNEIGSATAEILSGVKRLEDFQRQGACELDEALRPRCNIPISRPRAIVPLLELRAERGEAVASYRYRGKEEVIDEILVPEHQLPLLERGDGRRARGLRVGVEGDFFRGSDHRLTWAEFTLRH